MDPNSEMESNGEKIALKVSADDEITTATGNGKMHMINLKDENKENEDGEEGNGDASAVAAAESSSIDLTTLIPNHIPPSLSTSGLEFRLRQLREASTLHSQILTQKLASSQSGQNLLHMGTSLSTLPPDLHNLLTQLHPFVATVEQTEKDQMLRLQELVSAASKVQRQARRVQQAHAAANLYADLDGAERAVQRFKINAAASKEAKAFSPDLDEIAPLERAAHITICLLADLQEASEQVRHVTTSSSAATRTSMSADGSSGGGDASKKTPVVPSLRVVDKEDTESAQFLMKLAPRIRRLESDTVQALLQAVEELLIQVQEMRTSSTADVTASFAPTPTLVNDVGADNTGSSEASPTNGSSFKTSLSKAEAAAAEADLLLMLGHCMRGLAILGRSADVENVFARVAIMPLIRSKVSMGRLDEGGSRGECAGLFSLLDELTTTIQQTYGPVLCLAEFMFFVPNADPAAGGSMDIDLLTAGVWVPIATALMADAGIKMAIFSPGIASILQANYVALDTFLSELAGRLLLQNVAGNDVNKSEEGDDALFQISAVPNERIALAQDRIYAHPKTAEFSKRWNLPIYYQLRFGESCNRLNKAVELTKRQGWISEVFTGSEERAAELKNQIGFELTLFLELYDILTDLWRPDVILKPLTNRFLRGAVQLIGRTIAFISDSMEGKIKFGEEESDRSGAESDSGAGATTEPAYPTRAPYCWGDSEDDVAAVAWELAILESSIRHNYVDIIVEAIQPDGASFCQGAAELKSLVSEVLQESSEQINPIIDKAWNEIIVTLLTAKCSAPLSAVKGVAVMYRMTNRPPPTQPSSFVGTILRPLKDFNRSFTHRTPGAIGSKWKQQIVVTVSDRYAVAVDELLTTVQRTEEALKNRKARRIVAGGMSDGEKLKLQLYLDYKFYSQTVRELGVDPGTVIGLSKLKELTAEGEALQSRQQNEV